ncbi:DEAD/DEAH box helicase [Silicimonas algicola]|uniref:ATP-dependent RNA helicase DeaD n=1 Tax=Silicimonas algicola TaxID=1826607 RepID=A0A316G0N4_9RHOB|nr:DEAD/DEAH box helicase [Silicimonas algicola]AZQ68387.1 DEAD/DEAH box helicase [Silicimonas algicola]PWK53526.1 ATP-dependent RNA helicase DeaD [Silicimonas algicola]
MFQPLANALSKRGYDTLTAVQDAVTDPKLQDADLVVSAQTGSGKTVGFGLAIAHTILGADGTVGPAAAPLALIVAPTRELALQVMRELEWLYAEAGARVTTCIGGMDIRDERRALDRGAHIVVGTPGRLRDHIQRGSLEMGSLRAIVLDEADEMLDLGFREDLEFMLGEAPDDRRTLMFSATVPPMIEKLAKRFQRDAVRVTTLSAEGQHADIAYQAMRVAPHDAENAIINLLRFHDAENALVFANTRASVNRLTARLTNRGFSVVPLSGELSQSERTHALQALRDGRARVCVATDVAARGIDLPKLDLVIHAELPSNAESLLHRSGRTGRAGRKGISALIVPPKLASKAGRLLGMAKIEADWIAPPSAEEILQQDEERLLADPVWTMEPTPEQRDFAAKLLSLHGPERIAAAYLAMHQSRLSAPEDLADPGALPERKERAAFGPSSWISLSVGRDDRAEPRWLLPLLCRAGNLDKDSIGAIRVQQSESFVEILNSAVPGFLAAIGEDGELEKGVKARKLDAAPDVAPDRAPAPREPAQSPRQPERPAPSRSDERQDKRPTPKTRDTGPKAAAPRSLDKMARAIAEGAVKPIRTPKDRSGGSSAPGDDKPSKKTRWDKKPSGAPTGKFESKPTSKGAVKKDLRTDNSRSDARKTDGKAKGTSSAAGDTSKRFTPPGAAGRSGKPKPQSRFKPAGKPRKG